MKLVFNFYKVTKQLQKTAPLISFPLVIMATKV